MKSGLDLGFYRGGLENLKNVCIKSLLIEHSKKRQNQFEIISTNFDSCSIRHENETNTKMTTID